jgi:hypothetical protein
MPIWPTQRVFDQIFTVTEVLRMAGNFSEFGRQPGQSRR